MSLQDCSGIRYRRGRMKARFGVELGEGAFPGLRRMGHSRAVRKGTQRTLFLLVQKYNQR